MWHVSSRSGVATLRTAIHLLLTYLHRVTQNAAGRSLSIKPCPIFYAASRAPSCSCSTADFGGASRAPVRFLNQGQPQQSPHHCQRTCSMPGFSGLYSGLVFTCSWAPRARAVLTNGHNGHMPRAPGFFFLFEGPQLAVVKYFLKTNYLIVDATA